MLFDPAWLVFILPPFLLAGYVRVWIAMTVARGAQQPSRINLTGAEVAREVLRRAAIVEVQVEPGGGLLPTFYDHNRRVLRLAPDVYYGNSVVSVAFAAHEVGHAVAHRQGYGPLLYRQWVAPSAALLANAGPWFVVLGILLWAPEFVTVGASVFTLATFAVLSTLPVEIAASQRARTIMPELRVGAADEVDALNAAARAAMFHYLGRTVSSLLGPVLQWTRLTRPKDRVS